jgi:hypothetical protein
MNLLSLISEAVSIIFFFFCAVVIDVLAGRQRTAPLARLGVEDHRDLVQITRERGSAAHRAWCRECRECRECHVCRVLEAIKNLGVQMRESQSNVTTCSEVPTVNVE